MEREKQERMLAAAKELHELCKSIPLHECQSCPLHGGVLKACRVGTALPSVWEIPKLRKWTDEDAAMAKALQAAGARIVRRSQYDGKLSWYGEDGVGGRLPDGLLPGLLPGWEMRLPQIIEEAEA